MQDSILETIKQINDVRFEPKEAAKKIRDQIKPNFKGYDLYTYNQKI